MFRVIATYLGFSAELEEELYFATRRRPDGAGEKIITPQIQSSDPQIIHHPEGANQQHRFLSYNAPNATVAEGLAGSLSMVQGVSVQIVDDRKPEPTVEAAPEQIAEEPAQMGVAALVESEPVAEGQANAEGEPEPGAHADAD